MFDVRRVMRTQYRIDDYQQNYFVLSGFDDLLRVTLETDFAPLYAELDSLQDLNIAQLVESDELVSRGTQAYPAAKAELAGRSGGRSLPSMGSEERRVGKGGARKVRSRGSRYPTKKK